MVLVANSYGKGRVRILRVQRDGNEHRVRELSVLVMLHGDFERAYTHADNRTVIATDTIRNIVNIVARENVSAPAEVFCGMLADRFLARYAQVDAVSIATEETCWRRLHVNGVPHPHGFVLDANGKPTVRLEQTRTGRILHSGISGYTFLKSTGSGWVDFVHDDYTTLPETQDRIAATAMNASWRWSSLPDTVETANTTILTTMVDLFATTYSHGIQDSLYRMGEAALAAIPPIEEITLACPNKHYLPIDLSRFGLSADNMVFTPTDEPHGQIECTIRR